MKIISYDSKFGRIMQHIAESCMLNGMWFICCIPIFTVGAATTALYTVTIAIAEQREGDIFQQFVQAFKSNFKQATILWLILLAIGILLGTDIYILLHLRAATEGAVAGFWTLLLAMVIAACIVYAIELTFVFPLVARVENTNRAMLVNSLLVGTHYLNCFLAVFGIHFAMAFIAIRIFTPILILGEGLCALLSSYLFSPVIRAVTKKPEGADDKQGSSETLEDATEDEEDES